MHLKKPRRRAFTLIELLVVLAIIAVLVALTTAAVMRFRGVGVGSATKTNMGKVHAKLTDQWRGVTEGAHKDSLSHPANSAYANQAVALAGGVPLTDPAVRAKYVKLRQQQAFPTSFADAFWPDPSFRPLPPPPPLPKTAPNAWPGYVAYLAGLGIYPDEEKTGANWGTTVPPEVQQGICLLMILEKGPKTTGVSADDLGSAIGRVPFGNTTAPAAVDGWKRPILFTRTYNGQSASLAVLSSGRDGKYGVDPTTFAVGTQADAADNVLVTNP